MGEKGNVQVQCLSYVQTIHVQDELYKLQQVKAAHRGQDLCTPVGTKMSELLWEPNLETPDTGT